MNRFFTISIVVLMFGFVSESYAQIDKLKSAFIYNFAKNTNWPASYKSGNFVIAVLGKTGVTTELKKIAATRKIGPQKMVVVEYSSASQIQKCHIIFIAKGSSGELSSVLNKIGNTLVVTDKKGLTNSGAGKDFILQGSKLRFKMNKANITSRKLVISTAIERMAI